ncbi:MAG: hypothetical protein KDA99_28005, partial [Planctomycetales bacterium]|nr:hypothetical protein [Planctomycetales bacterium]
MSRTTTTFALATFTLLGLFAATAKAQQNSTLTSPPSGGHWKHPPTCTTPPYCPPGNWTPP